MKRLAIETVIEMHSALIEASGGLDGVRDINMLDASIASPYHTFGGQYLYPTLQVMAAHLAFSLVKNHPFLDGNKRIGILSMLTFLEINGISVECTNDELVAIGLGLAENTINENALVEWIISHS
ncbi:death-on-curing protein [Spirochaetia bacterium]|nr:death-on-curing protein [Spirochaetia bacterium]